MKPERRPTEDRQRQIADAALRIIAEQGVRRFTTAAVAKEVGLSEGAVFRHFPDKQAIVSAAISRVEELFFGVEPPSDADPLERLGRFVRYRLEVVHAHPGIPRIVFSEELAHAAGEEGARRVGAIKERSFAFIQGCIEEAAGRGLTVTGVPVEHVVLMVQGLLLALVFRGTDLKPAPPAPHRLWASSPQAAAERVWTSLERLIRRR